MKRHGKFMTVLGLGLAVSMVSQSVYAQSTNRISRVVTVGENTLLQTENNKGSEPALVIELEDELTEGNRFYLNLENAAWEEQVNVVVEGAEEAVVKANRISETELEVILEAGTLERGAILRIPMVATVTKGKAKVTIDHNNTGLSPQTLVFADTSTQKGSVIIGQVPKVVEGGVIAPITLEEAYPDQFKNDSVKDKNEVITFTIEEKGYEWDEKSLDRASVSGLKSFEGLTGGTELFKKVGPQTLEIRMPEGISEKSRSGRGALKIQGPQLKVMDQAPLGKVNVAIEGITVSTGVHTVLERADYEVKLIVKEQVKALTGEMVTASFSLEENMTGALLKDRSLDIFLSDGELTLNKEGKVDVKINETTYAYPPIMDGKRCIGFEINNLGEVPLESLLKYDMKFQVKLEAGMKQMSVKVCVEGRGLPEQKSVSAELLQVMPKVEIKTEAITLDEAQRDQKGGRVILTETQAGNFEEGEVIFLEFVHDEMSLSALPVVEVVSGDLRLGEVRKVPGGMEIPIEKASREASQIQIKNFGFNTTGAIANGYYELGIGGSAITDFEEEQITIADWIMVNVAPKNVRKVTFRLGEDAYNLNGKYYHIEEPPYLEDGRVMVPLKYVVEALGIPEEQVKWDKATQQITIYDKHVIELELGSTIMKVDGNKIYMPVATENKKGYTMVPMSEIAKALEVDVTWDEKLQTATFVTKR